jgi:hypothetical protein
MKQDRQTVKQQQDTAKEGNATEVHPVIGPETAPPHHNGNSSQKRWYQSIPWWRILEGLGIVAVITYTAITYRLWIDTVANFATDERAWIVVVRIEPDVRPNEVPKFKFVIKNFGKTPATNITAKGLIQLVTPPNKLQLFWLGVPPEPSPPVIMFPTEEGDLVVIGGMPAIPEQMLENVTLLKITKVYAYTAITYTDIFKRVHKTEACGYVGSDLRTVGVCPEGYNTGN